MAFRAAVRAWERAGHPRGEDKGENPNPRSAETRTRLVAGCPWASGPFLRLRLHMRKAGTLAPPTAQRAGAIRGDRPCGMCVCGARHLRERGKRPPNPRRRPRVCPSPPPHPAPISARGIPARQRGLRRPGAGQGDGESQRLLTGEVRTGLTGTGRERRPSPRRRGQARSEPRAALWMAGEAQRRN